MTPGRGMRAVAAYVRAHPGCSKADAVRATGSDYKTIARAVEAGLIGCHPTGGSIRVRRLYAPPPGAGGNST